MNRRRPTGFIPGKDEMMFMTSGEKEELDLFQVKIILIHSDDDACSNWFIISVGEMQTMLIRN